MNLYQELTYRSGTAGHALGPIETPLCQGRCCSNRTAPVFVTFGSHGMLFLCGDCRAWHTQIIRRALPELRRTR